MTTQPAPPQPDAIRTTAGKPRRQWPWLLGTVAAFGVGIAAGSATQSTQDTTRVAQPAPVTSTVTVTPAAPPPVVRTITAPPSTQTVTATVTRQESAAPAPSGPRGSVGDGTYKVGTDIAAGSYKTTGPRESGAAAHCYWARLGDDSGSNIIANDLTTGPTRFTTKTGEFVQISGCDFTKG